MREHLLAIVENGDWQQAHSSALLLLSKFPSEASSDLANIVRLKCNPNSVSLARHLSIEGQLLRDLDSTWRSRFKSEMESVPGGPFKMGSSDEEINFLFREETIPKIWIEYERPLHEINLETFRIDRFPVTNSLYQEFDMSYAFLPDRADHPVTEVDYFQARSFAAWCEKELPTEAQWEKSARGVDGRRYPWGNAAFETGAQLANCIEEGVADTSRVGLFSRGISPFGCYDMAGNVFEWTKGIGHPYPFQPTTVTREIEKPVLKGGAWSYNYQLMRCALRYVYYPASRKGTSIGFRCVSM